MTAAQGTTWDDTLFTPPPIQSACRRFIHGKIHAGDEVLLRRRREIGSAGLTPHTEMAVLN
jgi:hypothetical protein